MSGYPGKQTSAQFCTTFGKACIKHEGLLQVKVVSTKEMDCWLRYNTEEDTVRYINPSDDDGFKVVSSFFAASINYTTGNISTAFEFLCPK